MKLYSYLFFGFVSIINKTDFKDISAYGGRIWLSLAIIIYISGFLSKIDLSILDYFRSWEIIISLFIPIFIINYFLFLKKNRYKLLYSKYFKVETNTQYFIRITITIVFFIGGFISLIKF